MENRALLDSLSRLKAERDALRDKEAENNRQRDQAKKMVAQIERREMEKREKTKKKVTTPFFKKIECSHMSKFLRLKMIWSSPYKTSKYRTPEYKI